MNLLDMIHTHFYSICHGWRRTGFISLAQHKGSVQTDRPISAAGGDKRVIQTSNIIDQYFEPRRFACLLMPLIGEDRCRNIDKLIGIRALKGGRAKDYR